MNPQRTWADLCGDPRDSRGGARPPAHHLGVSAGTQQPAQCPLRAFLGSAALRMWATKSGGPARLELCMTPDGASCTPPAHTRPHHRVGAAQPHHGPVAGEAVTHTGLAVSPLTRRNEGHGDLRELGEAGRQLAARSPASPTPGEPSRAGGTEDASSALDSEPPRCRPALGIQSQLTGPFRVLL